jgi:hypothetical protein
VSELFASGRVIDLILGMVVLETLALVIFHRQTGRGVAPAALLPNVFAGVFLLLAVRGALVAAPWGLIDLCLLGAMAAHFADLRQRLRI